MAEKEYIEREALSQAILDLPPKMDEQGYGWLGRRGVWQMVNDFPAADVRPMVRGKWKYKEGGELCADGYYCTACGTGFHVHVPYFAEFNFCPNCGADMRAEEGET